MKPKIFEKINIPNNFKIISSVSSFEHIKNSNIVISYNSSTLIEALAARRIVIMPYFVKKIDWNRSLDIKGAVKIITKQSYFISYIEKAILSKTDLMKYYNNKNITKHRNRIIDKYFFNSDRKANLRMVNFLEKNI